MHSDSPDYQFDPESPGWLFHRSAAGAAITKDDVIRVLQANGDCASDPRILQLIIDGLEGELDPKPGRPKSVDIWSWKYLMAEVGVEDRAREISEERKAAKTGERGLLDPRIQAAEEIGAWLGIQRGRSLINILDRRKAAQKRPPIIE